MMVYKIVLSVCPSVRFLSGLLNSHACQNMYTVYNKFSVHQYDIRLSLCLPIRLPGSCSGCYYLLYGRILRQYDIWRRVVRNTHFSFSNVKVKQSMYIFTHFVSTCIFEYLIISKGLKISRQNCQILKAPPANQEHLSPLVTAFVLKNILRDTTRITCYIISTELHYNNPILNYLYWPFCRSLAYIRVGA